MNDQEMSNDTLWYSQPAREWNEALPLGNGSLGAMAFGEPLDERFQINDETAWSGSDTSEGSTRSVTPDEARGYLAAARAAILRDDYSAANEPLKQLQGGHSQSYLPFADLHIEYSPTDASARAEVSEYRRTLDLATGEHRVTFLLDGHEVRSASFISRPHGVLSYRLSTEYPGGLDVRARLSTPLRVLGEGERHGTIDLLVKMPSDVAPPHEEVSVGVEFDVRLPSLEGAVAVRSEPPGVASADNVLGVSSTQEVTILLTTQTTFSGLGRAPIGTARDSAAAAVTRLEAAAEDGYDLIRQRQRADHADLYERAHLNTGEAPDRPTDLRLRDANANGLMSTDPGLVGLLFNYGRYLLISCSRAGSLPANLQGIWNDMLRPPWSSNYTTNINLPMNYWGAEVANLSECSEPVFELLETVSRLGESTALRLYGAPGWVMHHNTDAWGFTAPAGDRTLDPACSFWPMGGAWLVQQFRARLEFSGPDATFDADVAWPIVRGAADFLLSWLIDVPGGGLGTLPSTSPENRFRSDGAVGSAASTSGMDVALTRDVFSLLQRLAVEVGREDDAIVTQVAFALDRLPMPRVGSTGTIVEWADEYNEFEPHHRHLSHLYFAYPGTTALTEELRAPVIASLDERGDEATGWSLTWKLALRARTRQPDKITDLLELTFRGMTEDRGPWVGGLYPNLLVAHPPFQIDGNLGFLGAFSEAILQSHLGMIELLPSLPVGLLDGAARGLIARPGVEVDIEWAAGTLTLVRLRARRGQVESIQVRYGMEGRIVTIEPGVEITLTGPELLQEDRA
jgi:alpha-L-fucosidase 2